MNTKGVARLYDRLTARERLPLIMAASARHDEPERQRLVQSAPQVHRRVPDHYGLSHALREVSDHHFMELLDLAARYFQAMGVLSQHKANDDALDYVLLLGFEFQTLRAGWRQFCAEQGIPAEALWEPLPGYDTLRSAEELARTIAFHPEGAAAFLERQARQGQPADAQIEVQVIDADIVARDLRRCLEARAAWWGGANRRPLRRLGAGRESTRRPRWSAAGPAGHPLGTRRGSRPTSSPGRPAGSTWEQSEKAKSLKRSRAKGLPQPFPC